MQLWCEFFPASPKGGSRRGGGGGGGGGGGRGEEGISDRRRFLT